MVIAVSSTLLTLVSIKSVGLYHANFPGATVSQDPLRLPAQIISGISFLGAGLILKRNNDVISGLTTAAVTWSVSALGIAVGANFISIAFMATLFFLIGIELIPMILEKITGIEFNEKVITMKLTINKELETKEIMKLAKQNQIKI
jgi:putative Mg2+ transporter-C (MgtC) family protein